MGYSWWLIPAEASSKPLSNTISRAAKQHDSPSFDAHVTLLSIETLPTGVTQDDLVNATKDVCKGAKSFGLESGEVQVGETFHRSVFLSFKESSNVTALRESILTALKSKSKAKSAPKSTTSAPHVSLYYGNGTPDEKHHVVLHMMDARTVDVSPDGVVEVTGLGKEVSVDALWLVEIDDEAKTNPDHWKVLHREKLAPSAATKAAPATTATSATPTEPKATVTAPTNGTTSTVVEKAKEVPAPAANGNGAEKEKAAPAATKENGTTNPPKESFVAKLKRLLCF